MHDININLTIRSLIDQGRNPDLYSKEALEKCIKMNEVSKGKIDALEVRINIKRKVQQNAASSRHA